MFGDYGRSKEDWLTSPVLLTINKRLVVKETVPLFTLLSENMRTSGGQFPSISLFFVKEVKRMQKM